MASIPAPIRVTLGLLATALDTVQELVEHAPELPMEAVGNSMQLSLRLQQHYAALLTRGDEFLANLRGAPEEAPAWATFDDTPAADVGEPPAAKWASDGVDDPGPDDLPPAHRASQPRHAGQGDPLLDAVETATAPAKKAARKAAKAGPVTVSVPKKAAAKKVTAKAAAAPAKPAGKKAAATAPASTRPDTTAEQVAAEASIALTEPAKTAAKAAKKTAKRAVKKAAPAKQARATAMTTENAAPAKRAPGRPRKAPAPTPAAEPAAETPAVAATLDADLDNGADSARPVSAFDLAADVPAPGIPDDPS